MAIWRRVPINAGDGCEKSERAAREGQLPGWARCLPSRPRRSAATSQSLSKPLSPNGRGISVGIADQYPRLETGACRRIVGRIEQLGRGMRDRWIAGAVEGVEDDGFAGAHM